jgi:predicted dehydrogenase
MNTQSRRSFIKQSSLAAAGTFALPHFSVGQSLGQKLNVACVGIGHMGSYAVAEAAKENFVAVCDVDWRDDPKVWKNRIPAQAAAEHSSAQKFTDYREMLDSLGDKIDAVLISTPDHSHFPAAMAAMERGKHVFVQKPLAHNIWQVRTLRKAMKKYGVQTVMGNQGHTWETMRLIVEWVQAGILGDVREVHCWTDRPMMPWFQRQESIPPKTAAVPSDFNWDLWQGPTLEREYSPEYLPTLWRGWWDYGVGALGDIGCHCLDAPFWALDLGLPDAVDVKLTEAPNSQYTAFGAHVTYHFPARGDKPPVKLHWYEGEPRPPMLPGMTELPSNGMYMVGSDETLYAAGMRPEGPTIWPRENMVKYRDVLKKRPLPRVEGGPIEELFTAIKGGPVPGSNFDYASPLTEVVLLGGLAIRSGKRIEYDAKNMRITNHPELNRFIKEPVRKGWSYGEDLW